MKQILQDLGGGATEVADVPAPLPAPGRVLIRSTCSLISAGTERSLVEFGKAGLIGKALQQPQRVNQAIQKMKTDGVLPTVEAIRSKLGQPMPLGYSNVGRVVETAEGFAAGERVLSNGRHAEFVSVPRNLVARVPDNVPDEHAAFAVLGAIALQGTRLAAPTLGETFVVTGLGLIGLLAVQILRASGCRVIGIDSNPQRLALAQGFGAETVDLSAGQDPVARCLASTSGRGADGVLICASTSSSEPVSQAARMSRKRGRIVLVGVTGLELDRAEFYEKELTFQVSCSYGPGRYDRDYEELGHDYPLGFVRWTEQRNFEAVLGLMAEGRLDVSELITHRFAIDDAPAAYKLLGDTPSALGIVITYPGAEEEPRHAVTLSGSATAQEPGTAVLGAIGAGNYGGRILLKAFAAAGADLHTIASASGVSASHYGRKFGFRNATSDAGAVIRESGIDTIAIATRHDSHARLTLDALAAGKNVFVEKPLCLTRDELAAIEEIAARSGAPRLMVGFNRRFAPMVRRMKALLDTVTMPKSFVMTVNAGAIPAADWVQDAAQGGRIVGEACHFIDLLRHLAGASVTRCEAVGFKPPGDAPLTDTASLLLQFADGSIGSLNYLANGHRSHPKERLEVFAGGRVLVLDNYRRLDAHGWPGFKGMRAWSQDKGQEACVKAFVDSIRSGAPSPIPLAEIVEVSRLAIETAERLG